MCLDLSVLTEMCVDIYLVEGRESRRAEHTLQRAKQKCGGDGGEKNTALNVTSTCYHEGVCRYSTPQVKNAISFPSNFLLLIVTGCV